MTKIVNIIGGGLAGCEAAFKLANNNIKVNLYEMRNKNKLTPQHHSDKLGELVCSNSFRNKNINSAIGLLHHEMRELGSLILESADLNSLPAGAALGIDREAFSKYITDKISEHKNINLIREEIKEIEGKRKDEIWLICSGPLTSDNLSKYIQKITDNDSLYFFDAIAPIIYKESIDFDIAWYQSRYDKNSDINNGQEGDYINIPLNKEQYYEFINDLKESEKISFKDWEMDTPYFEGCMPIEVMAERGDETLRFGPMKPVGLTNKHDGSKPYAVIQLRQDNKLDTLYNIVGFQTKMKYKEQKRILQKIPALEKAEFARFGGLHRNSFINSPKILTNNLSLKKKNNIFFAGQITGVEGYVESASIGLALGIFISKFLEEGSFPTKIPTNTALGSLIWYITEGFCETSSSNSTKKQRNFQPMNINFGIINSKKYIEEEINNRINNLSKENPGKKFRKPKLTKQEKGEIIASQAMKSINQWKKDNNIN
ncbi:MAG TPA: methylenetetrahydrofolate--tRNA-(uracil(54)-C(5))-methyltransferase (FADH(2)-oxidizing) TrmFO [Candidatus Megaira endosymbiont of Hartmannula sinica]|nr:methylenetetrahydrofolate--tRNA-(uracil(54)-C(5))-methyltransferase (FADH(2)-oxidizing) TrmFO [Candidatus Megaera endosymbiont of Hartmannula sinica]